MKLLAVLALAAVVSCGGDDAPIDEPPLITSALAIATMEDTPGVLNIAAHDPEGAALTFTVTTAPAHGAADLSGSRLTYTPASNYDGTDTIGVTVSDGGKTTTGTVSVTVSPVNDPPVGVADSLATQEDTPLVVGAAALIANDSDPDGDALTVTGAANATLGTIGFAGGMVTFTPFANASGAGSFTYTLSDGTASVDVPVTVAIGAANDPPAAVDDSATTAEDVPLTIAAATLLANDTDPDGQTPMLTAVANATNGTAVLAAGVVTFTPAANFVGEAGFDYTISDGMLTDTGHVAVTVTAVEDAPVALDDAATTPLETPLTIDAATLLANDADPDLGAVLSITAVSGAQHGTVSLAGTTITFTPAASFVGVARFDYTLSDGMLTDTGTVAVTVTPICGDGRVSAGEGCDDGGVAVGDGCNGACVVETGWTCAGSPTACTPICNDGMKVGSEVCDDGNPDNTDGCTTACVVGVLCNATAEPGGDHFAVDAQTGTCYAAFDDDTSAFAADEASCVALGGHLATITSAAEAALVHAVHAAAQTPYIGAADDANDTDAVFDWVTTEPWGFTAFAPGEPDDGPAGDGECLVLTGATSAWADTSCAAGAATGYICELPRATCGDGIVQSAHGEECDDGNATPGDGCDPTCLRETLYISEYVEGSSNNKAIELANPLTTPFDLAANTCVLKSFANGGATFSNQLALTGTIAPGDVFVACNTSITAAVAPVCDVLNNGVMGYNGDDALTLECNGVVLDSIGQVGVDPGTEWGTGLTSTADNTLRKKCSITHGDVTPGDSYDPAAMFVGFATDTFGDLGLATCAP